MLVIPAGDTVMPAVCWGACTPCGIANSLEQLEKITLNVFPNPATGTVNIQSTQSGTVRILDLTGRIVKEEKMEAGEHTLSLDGLNTGLYFVQLNGQHSNISQRLIVE
jgi:hypothetical protein